MHVSKETLNNMTITRPTLLRWLSFHSSTLREKRASLIGENKNKRQSNNRETPNTHVFNPNRFFCRQGKLSSFPVSAFPDGYCFRILVSGVGFGFGFDCLKHNRDVAGETTQQPS